MTNEKDANVIHNLFAEYHYADDLGVIKSKLAEYVATVRAEALKEAAKAVRGLYHKSEVSDSRWNAAIVHAEAAVEQLANRKGEG